jgi:hypothetical protein
MQPESVADQEKRLKRCAIQYFKISDELSV